MKHDSRGPGSIDRAMPDDFAVDLLYENGVVHVRLGGEHDAYSAPYVYKALRAAGEARCDILVDLREIEFVDSVVIRELVLARKAALAAGNHLAVCIEATNPARRVFEITALEEPFRLSATIEDALGALTAARRS